MLLEQVYHILEYFLGYTKGMIRTNPSEDVGKILDGYMTNIPFADSAARQVLSLQQSIEAQLGSAAWSQPVSSLHVTLFDFIAPKIQYDEPHKTIYTQEKAKINDVLCQLAQEFSSFTIFLDTICASQDAIYIKGSDNGSVDLIRKRFLELYTLDHRTKRPPQIIHSTIMRFTDNVALTNVERIISTESIAVSIPVTYLRLTHETQIPMLGYEELNRYLLQ